MTEGQTIHLGELPAHLRAAARHLFEVALAPLGLFYLLLTVSSLANGLWAALGWTLAALLWRVVMRSPIPMMLLVTTGILVVRTVVGLVTGSVVLYFAQPTLQNFLFAAALLLTLPLRRPLIARLAGDFCALPATLTEIPGVRRFFQQVSLLWAVVFALNGAGTLWTLTNASLSDFLVVTTAGSYTLVAVAASASLLWLRRALRREAILLRFSPAA
jgi:intracellular septation protein A